MPEGSSYVGKSSFSLKDDYKTLVYLLPLLCDWISTVQEDEVNEDSFITDLADGSILCRVLALIKESGVGDESYYDPVLSKEEARENLQLFLDISQKKLHFPTIFKYKDFNEDEANNCSKKTYGSAGQSRVVETLVYLAKVASKHRHLRNQMPRELYNYVHKKVKVNLVAPTVIDKISKIGTFMKKKDKDDHDDIYFKEEYASDEDDVDSDIEYDSGDVNSIFQKTLKKVISSPEVLVFGIVVGFIIGLVIGFSVGKKPVVDNQCEASAINVNHNNMGSPLVCKKEDNDIRTNFACIIDYQSGYRLDTTGGTRNLIEITPAEYNDNILHLPVRRKDLIIKIPVINDSRNNNQSGGKTNHMTIIASAIVLGGLAGAVGNIGMNMFTR